MAIDRARISHSIDDFEIAAASGLPIALDLETSGLTPFISEPSWISWASGNCTGAIPIKHRNPSIHNVDINRLKKILLKLHQRSDSSIIWHNAAFDISILIGAGWLTVDQINAKSIFDSMLASYILNPVKNNEGGKHSLKFLYREMKSEHDPDQPTYKITTQGREFSDVPFEEAKWYSAFDAWATLKIHGVLNHKLNQDPDLQKYFEMIEMPHVLTTIEILTTGMNLLEQSSLPEKCRSISDLYQDYDRAVTKVFELADHTFNFTSPDSLRRALFRKAGIDPVGSGKKSRKFSVDKWTLARVFAEVDATQTKYTDRKLRQKKLIAWTLYAKLLLENIKKHEEFVDGRNNGTKRIHPQLRQTTSSGRYSCRSPNTLSMSSTSKIKEHLVPSDGNAFVVADFGQIDLRVIANETAVVNERSGMAEAVNKGVDLHYNTLAIVDRETERLNIKRVHKLEKVERKDGAVIDLTANPQLIPQIESIKKKRASVAKPLNFGISYGLGPKGLLGNLNNSEKFQDVIFNKFENQIGEEDWLASLTEKIPKNKFTLEQAHQYLFKFHETYPEIPEFQRSIEENDLQSNGSTVNIFGRRSRAEGVQYLLSSEAIVDVSTGHGEWYRVHCKGLNFSKRGYRALVTKVRKLKVEKEIENRKLDEGPAIFNFDLSRFEQLVAQLNSGQIDEFNWRDCVFDLVEDGMWGGEDFLEQVSSAAPNLHPQLTTMSDHPCFPFVKLTHPQIKFIQTGPLETFMRYPGYDALRRKLISYRVSSTSMDICKIAMIEFRKAALECFQSGALKSRPKIINCIHDEIAVECHQDDIDSVGNILRGCMSFKSFDHKLYLAEGRELLVQIEAEIGSSSESYAKAKPA